MNGAVYHDNGDHDSSSPSFVASDTWKGSRPGYYFGTGPKGTGYYLDAINSKDNKGGTKERRSNRDDSLGEGDGEGTQSVATQSKKRARTVLFDDNRNTTLEYEAPPRRLQHNEDDDNYDAAASTRARRQLEEAERNVEASHRIVVDATPRGARAAIRHLRKAHEDNAVMRAEHDDDPSLYMESEVNLYEHIQGLKSLAADPAALYPVVLVGTNDSGATTTAEGDGGGWETIAELLGHPNPDMVASVINLLLEWLDSSLLVPVATAHVGGEEGGGNAAAQQRQNDAVIDLARCVVRDGLETIVTQHLVRDLDNDNDNGGDDKGDDDENDDEVGKGKDDILSLLENLLEMDQFLQASSSSSPSTLAPDGSSSSLAAQICQYGTLHWLFRQIHESTRFHDRALELLVLVAARDDVYTIVPDWSQIGTNIPPPPMLGDRHSQPARIPNDDEKEKESTLDGIELLLQTTAKFRKRQPNHEAELSVLENTCMVMSAALLYSPANLSAFVERQGVELVLRCLQERVHAGGLALKWLDVGTIPPASTASNENGMNGSIEAKHTNGADNARRAFCEHMVKAGAFKYLFPMLMGRHAPKAAPTALAASKRAKREWNSTLEATVISILYCLTVYLTDDSPYDAKKRFVAKFVEEEKCDRLVELCLRYDHKARKAEFDFYRDVEDEIDPDLAPVAALAAKLEGGGDVLHRVCAVAAFCCVESRRCHERVLSQLKLQQSGITLVRDALQEFAANLEAGAPQKAQLEAYLERL